MFGEVSGADVWESEDDINKKKKILEWGYLRKVFCVILFGHEYLSFYADNDLPSWPS